jgi:predicted RNA-binding protein with RPS1 domain
VVKIDERDRIRLSLKAITDEERAQMEQKVGSDG